jgi:hypothetical protein
MTEERRDALSGFPLVSPPNWFQNAPSSSRTAVYLSLAKLNRTLISEILHGVLNTIAEHQAIEIAKEQM